MAALNSLDQTRKQALLRLVTGVFSTYDKVMRGLRFGEVEAVVRRIKKDFSSDKSITALIGGVFAIWSTTSISPQCPTPRKPLAAQVPSWPFAYTAS
jgi:hypothetical protein